MPIILNPQRAAALTAIAQELDGKLAEAGLTPAERFDFVLGSAASYSWLLQLEPDDVQRRFLALRTEAARHNPLGPWK